MKVKRLRCTAINAVLMLLLVCLGSSAYAATAGTVTQLSGVLLAIKPDSTVKVLAQKSIVEQGDTLVTKNDTYAQIKFIDNSEMTLRPNSQLKIDRFSYQEEKAENDSAVFSLIKGGLRAITGALGKRNNERFGLNTPTATIGIRGTIFIAEYIPDSSGSVAQYRQASLASTSLLFPLSWNEIRSDVESIDGMTSLALSGLVPLQLAQSSTGQNSSGLAPGLYVHVIDGLINLSNRGGVQQFSAGQFGFTGSVVQAPVIVPNNPGIQFNPPPGFSSSAGPQGNAANTGKKNNVNCEVR